MTTGEIAFRDSSTRVPPDNAPELLELCDRLLAHAADHSDRTAFLNVALSDLAVEYGASWLGIATRQPDWDILAEHGRKPQQDLPWSLFAEALDRDGGCWSGDTSGNPGTWIATVIAGNTLLALNGSRLNRADVPSAMTAGRYLGHALKCLENLESALHRVTQLRATLEIARTFAREKETQPLLELIAHESTKLMHCDRASIFIWDREQKQIVACPALGVEGGRLWLPDNKGIVGEVIHSGNAIRVDDAYSDPRFDQSVDKTSGYRTRNLLCVPMQDSEGRCIGAFELINKHDGPFTDADLEAAAELSIQAAIAVQNARERDHLIRSNRQLTEQVTGGVMIIGESPAVAAMRSTIERLAATDLPVLILGESGTGKEVAAQALHYHGPRAEHPFVAVNCAALSETLLESELFGHEKGAFTDAHATHVGKFELAEGGTLFLDEIGDMSLNGQAKLLRVLEQKVITRVGGSQAIPINVRVIAATNANLAEAVREKRFRQDLFYRLSVVTVDIPPLRERAEDVIPLAMFFLDRFCQQANRKPLELSPDARRRLQSHAWPGNVRELRNLMERVAFLAPGPRVEPNDIAFILSPERDAFDDLAEGIGLTDATQRFQQEYIRRAIKRVQGNMSDAARLLGLHRSNLYRKMRQLGMEVTEAKE
ncbi:sigma-54-dependent Fis family transcriptional regulator [Maioricimonas sp. JC845]|uniref:sigma-54-dependent Fis family transcriptional regulator n=1 Tax=Maioricimonas sp. JC845 TaxID=3232138 RepID=UPI00345A113C